MKRFLLLFITGFLISINLLQGLFFGRISTAFAEESIAVIWINYSAVSLTVQGGSKAMNDQSGEYQLVSAPDGKMIYTLRGGDPESDCTSLIEFDRANPPGLPGGDKGHQIFPDANDINTIKLRVKSGKGNECNEIKRDASPKDTENSRIMFYWVDASSIEPVGNLPFATPEGRFGENLELDKFGLFTFNDAENIFQYKSAARCFDKLSVDLNDKKSATFSPWNRSRGSCDNDGNFTKISGAQVGKLENSTKQAGSGTPSTSAGSLGSAGGADDSTCEVAGGSPLSWILCPLINGGAGLADWVFETVLIPFLENVPISADSSDPVYKIWSGFRILANVLLIGALLSVVISQAVGKE